MTGTAFKLTIILVNTSSTSVEAAQHNIALVELMCTLYVQSATTHCAVDGGTWRLTHCKLCKVFCLSPLENRIQKRRSMFSMDSCKMTLGCDNFQHIFEIEKCENLFIISALS